jgi:hypothetical protein
MTASSPRTSFPASSLFVPTTYRQHAETTGISKPGGQQGRAHRLTPVRIPDRHGGMRAHRLTPVRIPDREGPMICRLRNEARGRNSLAVVCPRTAVGGVRRRIYDVTVGRRRGDVRRGPRRSMQIWKPSDRTRAKKGTLRGFLEAKTPVWSSCTTQPGCRDETISGRPSFQARCH